MRNMALPLCLFIPTCMWLGCSSPPPQAKPALLVTQDDEITASPGETVKVNLLENDANPIDNVKFLRFRVPNGRWGKPGTLIAPGWNNGEITYKVPQTPGVYEFDYVLYGHDPTASHSPDFSPPKPVSGKLIVTVVAG